MTAKAERNTAYATFTRCSDIGPRTSLFPTSVPPFCRIAQALAGAILLPDYITVGKRRRPFEIG